jgi:hypothetical protein
MSEQSETGGHGTYDDAFRPNHTNVTGGSTGGQPPPIVEEVPVDDVVPPDDVEPEPATPSAPAPAEPSEGDE